MFLFSLYRSRKEKQDTNKKTHVFLLSTKCAKMFSILLSTNIMYCLKNILLFYVNFSSNTDAVKTLPQHDTLIFWFFFTDEIPTLIYHTNQISLFSVAIRRSTNSIFFPVQADSHPVTVPLTSCSFLSSVPVLVPVL